MNHDSEILDRALKLEAEDSATYESFGAVDELDKPDCFCIAASLGRTSSEALDFATEVTSALNPTKQVQ